MKSYMRVIEEVDVKYVLVEFELDEEDLEAFEDFPLMNEDHLCKFMIDIDEGKIVDWPLGVCEHISVCIKDSGNFELFDRNGSKIFASSSGYVPNNLLPGSYGDTLDLNIDETGKILNWYSKPTLEDFEEFNIEENF